MSKFTAAMTKVCKAHKPRIQEYQSAIKLIESPDHTHWISEDLNRLPELVNIMATHSVQDQRPWTSLLKKAASMSSIWPMTVVSQICGDAARAGVVDSLLCELVIQRRDEFVDCPDSAGSLIQLVSHIGCSDPSVIADLVSLVSKHREFMKARHLVHALRVFSKVGIADQTLAFHLSELVQAEKTLLSIRDVAYLIHSLACNGIIDSQITHRLLTFRLDCIRAASIDDALILLKAISRSSIGNIPVILICLEKLVAAIPDRKNGLDLAIIGLSAMAQSRFIQIPIMQKICGHVKRLVAAGETCHFPYLLESLASLDVFLPEICTPERLAVKETGRRALSLARGAWSVSAGYHTGSLASFLPIAARAIETNNLSTEDRRWLIHSFLFNGLPALSEAMKKVELSVLHAILKGVSNEIPSDRKDGRYYYDSNVIDFIQRKTGLVVDSSSVVAGFEFYSAKPARSVVTLEAVG